MGYFWFWLRFDSAKTPENFIRFKILKECPKIYKMNQDISFMIQADFHHLHAIY